MKNIQVDEQELRVGQGNVRGWIRVVKSCLLKQTLVSIVSFPFHLLFFIIIRYCAAVIYCP